MADFTLRDHGSVVILKPVNDGAEDWIFENLPNALGWGEKCVVVEPRYVDGLLDTLTKGGFDVEEV